MYIIYNVFINIYWPEASALTKHSNYIFINKYIFINGGPNCKFFLRLRNNLEIINVRIYSDTGILLVQEIDIYLFYLCKYKHIF